MTDQATAPSGGEAIADTSDLTITEARDLLFSNLDKEQPAESAEEATAEPKLAEEANADSPKETTGEDEVIEPEKPAIDPPKSWTKDLHEHWATLDPVLQERIVARDREDQAAIKRAFNEAADERKAVKAEREAAEKARQQYEASAIASEKALLETQNNRFPDIKSMEDVEKLARTAREVAETDPFTSQKIIAYLADWNAHQQSLQMRSHEADQARARQAQERQSKRAAYEAEQNKLLVELVPEMAEPKKASELRERAIAMLNDDLGLKTDLLTRWMQDDTGHEILSNAGIQKLMADGLKYRDIQKAPKAVAAKPLPTVQRPGVARPAGASNSELIQNLEAKLTRTGSIKDAEALLNAKLAAQQRRAS